MIPFLCKTKHISFLTGENVIFDPKMKIHVDTPYSSMTILQYVVVCVYDILNPKNIVQPVIRYNEIECIIIFRDRYKLPIWDLNLNF